MWSFTAPRINGSIDGTLGAKCYTFTRAAGEADGAYWFNSMRTAGTLSPYWRVYGPSGTSECSGYPGGDYQRCQLRASGQFTVVVEDGNQTEAGSFFLTAKQTTSPAGCGTLPSVAFGISPVSGNLSTAGEIDCYALSASDGDVLSFTTSGSADRFAVVDSAGVQRCYQSGGDCTINGDGPFALLVYSGASTATGSYRFEATCKNVPCGQSNTAVTDVVPNRVGPSEFTTVLLRGRDLDLLQSAKLVRGGTVVNGEVQEAASDGRARDVRFDLYGAGSGGWELQTTFIDGTTRSVPNAVTVEALRPAKISAELVGRSAFRIGQANAVTVVVSNAGNEDAIGVPVALYGIPEGATIEPSFDLHKPTGQVGSVNVVKSSFNQSTDTVTENGKIAVPLFVSRVPAARSVRMEFRITAPGPVDYSLHANAGDCVGTKTPASAAASGSSGTPTRAGENNAINCSGSIVSAASTLAGFLPGAACGAAATDLFVSGAKAAGGGQSFWSWGNALSWGLGAVDCATSFIPEAQAAKVGWKLLKASIDGASLGKSVYDLATDCANMVNDIALAQRGVAAIDPNDIRGPVGSGASRYIPGDEQLNYQVLFENLPTATAPAQRIEIKDQLDTGKFDPASVLFQDIRFGSTVYTLPYAGPEVDRMIDLRPAQPLLVHATAGVTSAGQVHWELQAIDPETLAPPTDPLVGFLPPNASPPKGEGLVSFGVNLKGIASGTVVPNMASIVFDNNPAIETPTWTNTIDKQAPSVSVSANGNADPKSATVSWAGTDDAAGIDRYDLRVSKNGGPSILWRAASSAGSDTYTATESGSYSFRATAHDGAGNVGQWPNRRWHSP